MDKPAGEWIKPCSAPDAEGILFVLLCKSSEVSAGEEDIEAGTVIWEVVCKSVLEYGSEVWACPSLDSERKLEQVQERAERAILGLSWRFPRVAIRGDMGGARLKYGRHVLQGVEVYG